MEPGIDNGIKEAVLGIIRLTEVAVSPSPEELRTRILNRIAGLKEPSGDEEEVKKAVRNLLRHGKYKPSGRGKPASEYLLESAREGSFPFISNVVDALNLVSVSSLLPISLIDTEKAGSPRFRIRRGRELESYIFNRSGQVLNLEDLLLVSVLDDDLPVASPIKDSQRTKVCENTKEALAVIYSPLALEGRLREAASFLAKEFGGFSRASFEIVFPGNVT